jgi:cobalt-zinc-cadmium efflux system outer membrane protein
MRHFRLRRAACFILAAHCAACASAGRAPDRADVARDLNARAGTTATLEGPREWTMPPDVSATTPLSMPDAVAVALWNNAEFHAALADLGLARADLIDAGMLRNPILSLLFPWGPKQLEATINWPVDALWQRPRRIAQARLNADAAAQQLVSHGLRLIADVKTAFVDVVAAERAIAIAGEHATLTAQIADLAAGRLRAGDISAFEAGLARLEAARVEASRLSRVATRDRARARLRALLGMPHGAADLRISDAPLEWPACGGIDELMKVALASRPEVRAAELRVEAAAARIGLEQSRVMSVTAILDMNAEGRQGFEAGPGLGLELPVLSQNQGGRARAAAELEQASRRYLAVRARVTADVDAAIATHDAALAIQKMLTTQVAESYDAERRQAQRMYEVGEISLLDLLETRRRLIDVEQTRAEATFATWRAGIDVEAAIGRSCGR